MSNNFWPISWWEYTGRYSEEIDGISSPIMRNIESGEELNSRKLPYGACYDATVDVKDLSKRVTYYDDRLGSDGKYILCRCPITNPPDGSGGFWRIDSMCSNCTKRNDNIHRCWVRHGTVGEKLHVDKAGNTCAAGAGSIQIENWHGFIDRGYLCENRQGHP